MNIFIPNSSPCYENLWKKMGHSIVDSMEQADAFQFTGGEDVSPHLYGCPKHRYTHSSSVRDSVERVVFNYGFAHSKPMFGICRGAQFLNVMNGGRMYQHVSNHCQDHSLTDVETGRKLLVSSTHHQMMIPGPGATIVATAQQEGFKEYVDHNTGVIRNYGDDDIEVLYYPLSMSLCFQPHPEFVQARYEPMQEYYFELINRFIKETV